MRSFNTLHGMLSGLLMFGGCVLCSTAEAEDYYVATDGSDTNAGSYAEPFATLGQAQLAVRAVLPGATEPIHVRVRGGTYYLMETLEFGTADSGSAVVPVTWSGYSNETVIISGAIPLSPVWSTYSGSIQVANIGSGLTFDMLFVNSELQIMARYPDYDPDVNILNGYASDAISSSKVSGWSDPSGGFVRGLHGNEWGGNSFRITGKSGSSLNLDWVGDNNRGSGLHANYRMVENIFEELDAEGEWFYDEPAGNLYFYPPAGVDPSTAFFEAASLGELIRVVGTAGTKVQHLTFSNFTFTGTHRTLFTRPYEAMNRSDWRLARAGAIFIQNAEQVTISDSVFDRIGGNGVFMSNYNRNHLITNNEFLDNGATCVNVCGSKAALWDVNEWDDYVTEESQIDAAIEIGPKTDDYPKDITISYNHMYNMGRFEKQTSGVNLFLAESITIRHNTIHSSPRAGLNICDGAWGGHIIEFNDVYDCIRETHDHGPFNSWGRDRFYSIGGYNHNGADGAIKRPYAFLEAWKTTHIRNNRFHYDEPTQFGIDLDDGSSNYEIYNNLILNTSVKLREGFSRKVYNNIMINRGLDLHVWYAQCRDVLSNNIIVAASAYNPINVGGSDEEAYTDYNVFFNGDNPVNVDSFNWTASDQHSVTDNPLFINPAVNDYTVASNSPALALGFVNFPMDQFGKPGAPEPGPISYDAGIPPASDAEPLMGASISSIYDDGIQSVLGAPDHNGVFFESLPYGSYAEAQGFRQYDLIRAVNGTSITTKQSFWLIYNSIPGGATVDIALWRNQHEMSFSFVKTDGFEHLNDTAGIIYTGSWSTQEKVNCYNGDFRTTVNAGDAFEMTFHGTDVSFESIKGSDRGGVDVYIDGVFDRTVSCYSASTLYQETVYIKTGLTEGLHTLRVVNAESKPMSLDSVHVGQLPTLNWQVSTSKSDTTVPTVSSSDLAQVYASEISATGGEAVEERADELFNGIIGNDTSGTSDIGVIRMTRDNVVTVTFNTEAYPLGYELTGITSVFGWDTGNGGRSNQGYEIILTFVDGSVVTLAGPEHWEPNSPASYWTTVSFTPDGTNTVMASGVKAVAFDISHNANANGVVIAREFDIFGTPIRGEGGLVAHWPMDEGAGTVAGDVSGNNYHGSITGAAWEPGQVGGALYFNGTDAVVDIPATTFNTIGSEITVAMWVYGGDTLPRQNSILHAEDASGNRVLNIHLPWETGEVYWDAGQDSGYDRISKVATAGDYKGQWSHWVFTKNAGAGDMKIYHNGAPWHSGTNHTRIITGITEASFGAHVSSSRYYEGLIGDLKLFNIALTDAEVGDLYEDKTVHVPVFSPDSSVSNGQFEAAFSGTYGEHYVVECTERLSNSAVWSVVTEYASLDESPVTFSVPATNDTSFYRVRLSP